MSGARDSDCTSSDRRIALTLFFLLLIVIFRVFNVCTISSIHHLLSYDVDVHCIECLHLIEILDFFFLLSFLSTRSTFSFMSDDRNLFDSKL